MFKLCGCVTLLLVDVIEVRIQVSICDHLIASVLGRRRSPSYFYIQIVQLLFYCSSATVLSLVSSLIARYLSYLARKRGHYNCRFCNYEHCLNACTYRSMLYQCPYLMFALHSPPTELITTSQSSRWINTDALLKYPSSS
jgi:hypothetical protein